MPVLTVPNRRQFLAAAFAGATTLVAAGKNTRWAFFSDTHVSVDPANEYRGFRPYDNLSTVVPQVAKSGVDGAVISGDLARLTGLAGDYAQFKKLLDPLSNEMPVAMTLGNHDHRGNFLEAIRQTPGKRQPVEKKYVLALDAGPVRFLLLDSLIRTNFTPGQLGKAQRTWLDKYLTAAPAKPTILFVHHTLDDGDNSLVDVLWLFRVIEPHKSVKAVIYGHSHVYKLEQHKGIHLINLPAVGYNFTGEQPVGWVEANLTGEGAGFTLHAIGGNTADDGKTTSVRWRG